jgi:hypothetical protein
MGTFHGVDYCPDTSKIVFTQSEDVEPLIEHLAKLRQDSDGKSKSGEMYHVGDIPMTVVQDYLNTTGVSYMEFIRNDVHIKRILMNPDFSKFRVWQGRF